MSAIRLQMEKEGKIMLFGNMGMSKTTLFYELLCDYYDEDYFVLFNTSEPIINIKNVFDFINELLLKDDKLKILIGVDNAHSTEKIEIFTLIDKMKNSLHAGRILFLLTSRPHELQNLMKTSQNILTQYKKDYIFLKVKRNT